MGGISTYRVRRCLRWEEQKGPNDIACAVCNEKHSASNGLLREASNIGGYHRQADGNAGGICNKDPESEQLASLTRTIADEDASCQTGNAVSEAKKEEEYRHVPDKT